MNRLHLAWLHAALATLSLPLAAQSAPTAADSAAIAENARAFSAAFVRNDVTALGELYTEDAMLLPSQREVRGRAAIERYWTRGPNQQQVAHSLRTESMLQDRNMIVEVGTWTSTTQRADSTPVTAAGRYLVVWVRGADARWRMQYDMWHPPVK